MNSSIFLSRYNKICPVCLEKCLVRCYGANPLFHLRLLFVFDFAGFWEDLEYLAQSQLTAGPEAGAKNVKKSAVTMASAVNLKIP